MGSNQSKSHRLVEEQLLAKLHLRRRNAGITRETPQLARVAARTVNMPVSSLRTVALTRDEDYDTDLRARWQQGWTSLCKRSGIHSATSRARALVVALGLGAFCLWPKHWQEMKDAFGETWEQWAIRIMWTLEDEMDHAWNLLRMFAQNRFFVSKDELVDAIVEQYKEAKRKGKQGQLCWNCFKAKLSTCPLRKCSSCGIARYCTEACQSMDWANHKTICVALRQQDWTGPPGIKHLLKRTRLEADCIDRALAKPHNPQEG